MKFQYLFLFLLIMGCSSNEEKPKEVKWSKEKSMELNKTIAMEEKIAIKLFLAQHHDWKMTETGTGLHYFIYQKSDKDSVKVGSTVDFEYSVSKLDGTICYKTPKDEVVEIVVDHSEIETGLQEGIKKMKVGEKAKMIIPSHLAHGLTGDFNKIPPLTTIIVDIHIIAIVK